MRNSVVNDKTDRLLNLALDSVCLLKLYCAGKCACIVEVTMFKQDFSKSTILRRQRSDPQGIGYWQVCDDRDDFSNNYTYQFNRCGVIINKNNLNEMCKNGAVRKNNAYPIGYCNDISINGTCIVWCVAVCCRFVCECCASGAV